jgi:predicted nucleotidyltransferase
MERGANGINNSIEILPHPFLNHNETQLLKAFVAKIFSFQPSVKRLYLYGSKARGDFLEESDLDLLIVTDRLLSRRERFEINDLLFELEVQYDVTVSTVYVTIEDIEAKKSLFLREVYKEGILLWSRE